MASYQQSSQRANLGGNCVSELENSRLRVSAGRRRECARFLADPCRLRFEGFATAIGHQTLFPGAAPVAIVCSRWRSRTQKPGNSVLGLICCTATASPRHAHSVTIALSQTGLANLEDALTRKI